VEETHYAPDAWRGKYHTTKVRNELEALFPLQIVLFIRELFGIVLTPAILWWSLPQSSDSIVDFFREFTVYVNGIGYVCSFALFDFGKHGNMLYGAPAQSIQQQQQRYASKQGKMEKSFVNFKMNHPEWEPQDPFGSTYLERIGEYGTKLRAGADAFSKASAHNSLVGLSPNVLRPTKTKNVEVPTTSAENSRLFMSLLVDQQHWEQGFKGGGIFSIINQFYEQNTFM